MFFGQELRSGIRITDNTIAERSGHRITDGKTVDALGAGAAAAFRE